MAQYLILIYGDEQQWDERSVQERRRIDEGHAAFAAKAGSAIIAGGELQPTSTATSLRVGSTAPTVTDGPFLETKEALGGFYLLEAADLDEAIALAEQLPEVAVAHSGVEIRPVQQAG
jgi:hypothetical protein